MSTHAQSIAASDAVASVAGKLTVASGAGTAVYGAVNSELLVTACGLLFTAGSFFINWFYERRAKQIKLREIELNATLQREKNAREYELQRQRLEIEQRDRAEQRRIMLEAMQRAEERKAEESAARIAAMQSGQRPIFAPDSVIGAPLALAQQGKEGEFVGANNHLPREGEK